MDPMPSYPTYSVMTAPSRLVSERQQQLRCIMPYAARMETLPTNVIAFLRHADELLMGKSDAGGVASTHDEADVLAECAVRCALCEVEAKLIEVEQAEATMLANGATTGASEAWRATEFFRSMVMQSARDERYALQQLAAMINVVLARWPASAVGTSYGAAFLPPPVPGVAPDFDNQPSCCLGTSLGGLSSSSNNNNNNSHPSSPNMLAAPFLSMNLFGALTAAATAASDAATAAAFGMCSPVPSMCGGEDPEMSASSHVKGRSPLFAAPAGDRGGEETTIVESVVMMDSPRLRKRRKPGEGSTIRLDVMGKEEDKGTEEAPAAKDGVVVEDDDDDDVARRRRVGGEQHGGEENPLLGTTATTTRTTTTTTTAAPTTSAAPPQRVALQPKLQPDDADLDSPFDDAEVARQLLLARQALADGDAALRGGPSSPPPQNGASAASTAKSDPARASDFYRSARTRLELLRCCVRPDDAASLHEATLLCRSSLSKAAQQSHVLENCTVERGSACAWPSEEDREDAKETIEKLYDLDYDRPLGCGSYGRVLRCTRRRDGEVFACKTLALPYANDQALDRLHAEISAMRRLDHPNICRLYDVFYTKRRAHLVMDLCTGGELWDFCCSPPPPWEESIGQPPLMATNCHVHGPPRGLNDNDDDAPPPPSSPPPPPPSPPHGADDITATQQQQRQQQGTHHHHHHHHHPPTAPPSSGASTRRRPRPIHEAVVARFAREMVSAVKYMHSRGICHRDLKPQNFLLASRAPGAPLMLVDFGLAKQLREAAEAEKALDAAMEAADTMVSCCSLEETCGHGPAMDVMMDVMMMGDAPPPPAAHDAMMPALTEEQAPADEEDEEGGSSSTGGPSSSSAAKRPSPPRQRTAIVHREDHLEDLVDVCCSDMASGSLSLHDGGSQPLKRDREGLPMMRPASPGSDLNMALDGAPARHRRSTGSLRALGQQQREDPHGRTPAKPRGGRGYHGGALSTTMATTTTTANPLVDSSSDGSSTGARHKAKLATSLAGLDAGGLAISSSEPGPSPRRRRSTSSSSGDHFSISGTTTGASSFSAGAMPPQQQQRRRARMHALFFSDRVGSFYFVAPEVLRGAHDARCDLWSIGIIVYLLLCGSPPFCGRTDREILERVARARLAFPRRAFGAVSTEARLFVARLLERDVDRRLTAADALCDPWIVDHTKSSMIMPGVGHHHRHPRSRGHSNNSSSSNTTTNRGPHPHRRPSADVARTRQIRTSLRAYASLTALEKLTMLTVASRSAPRRLEPIRLDFVAFDTDGDGALSLREFYAALGGGKSVSSTSLSSAAGDSPVAAAAKLSRSVSSSASRDGGDVDFHEDETVTGFFIVDSSNNGAHWLHEDDDDNNADTHAGSTKLLRGTNGTMDGLVINGSSSSSSFADKVAAMSTMDHDDDVAAVAAAPPVAAEAFLPPPTEGSEPPPLTAAKVDSPVMIEEAAALFECLDVRGTGESVSYREFCAAAMCGGRVAVDLEGTLQDAFETLDLRRDGRVGIREVRAFVGIDRVVGRDYEDAASYLEVFDDAASRASLGTMSRRNTPLLDHQLSNRSNVSLASGTATVINNHHSNQLTSHASPSPRPVLRHHGPLANDVSMRTVDSSFRSLGSRIEDISMRSLASDDQHPFSDCDLDEADHPRESLNWAQFVSNINDLSASQIDR